MFNFLQKNSWALILAAVTIISSYTLAGYRLSEVEAQVSEFQQTVDTSDAVMQQVQLSLRELEVEVKNISSDTDQINFKLDQLFGPIR